MRIHHSFLLAAILLATAASAQPQTKKERKVFDEHGLQRTDDYFWLGNPKDTNVINHLEEENAYVSAYMKHTALLQEKLYGELVGRIEQKYASLPQKANGYWYYTRFDEGRQYPYYARKKGTVAAREEIMLNVPQLAEGHKIYLLRGSKVSPDNASLAYGIDTLGDRRSALYLKSINTGSQQAEYITGNTSGAYAWSKDNRNVYYVLNDPTVRPYKVMRHTIGTAVESDQEVYAEKDSTYRVNLYASKDGRYIFIHCGSTMTSESRYIDATHPSLPPVLIQARQTGIEYYPDYEEGNVFHIYTNKGAKNFMYVTAPIANPSVANWKVLIPHSETAFLENMVVLRDYYVTQTKENGLTQIRIFDRKKKTWKKVDFGQDAYVANMSMATDDYGSDSIRYQFTSLITPFTDYKYSLGTGQKKMLKQQQVKGYDPSLYQTKRIWITATDGTKVPVSIAYRKNKFSQDGKSPMLLYAYGSYGANSDPYFNAANISLMDRGVAYAIAHIRGGQELGRQWYEGGKVLTKQHTFTDFTDAAQALVNEKYTAPDRLFANGVSAGGMLMGAVTNQRPDLFRGIIAEVPWMDVITDMFDASLPLTTLEYDEWGDPNRKEHYDYMMTWSPLDNVKQANYPAIFATGGLNDTQVPYSSPAKWVAKVREHNTGTNPVLFQVNMGAGHGGESGRFERQKLQALKFAFLLDQLGWSEAMQTYGNGKSF